MVAFTAIIPHTPLFKGSPAAAERELKAWAGNVHRRVAKYPPQRPTRYRRTGTLGRNWRQQFGRQGGDLVATVANPTLYAPYVQGERQVSYHAAAGWERLDRVGAEEWKKSEPRIRKALEP